MRKDNGMMTSVWGPTGWNFGHCVTMGYPCKIDLDCKEHVKRMKETKKFFESMGYVLPCKYCRESYQQFISELPLTDNILMSRKKLAKWFYNIHNKVNKKLGVKDSTVPTFKKFYEQFDSYRAGCSSRKSKKSSGRSSGRTSKKSGRSSGRSSKRTSKKSVKPVKFTGCTMPAHGHKMKCIVKIVRD